MTHKGKKQRRRWRRKQPGSNFFYRIFYSSTIRVKGCSSWSDLSCFMRVFDFGRIINAISYIAVPVYTYYFPFSGAIYQLIVNNCVKIFAQISTSGVDGDTSVLFSSHLRSRKLEDLHFLIGPVGATTSEGTRLNFPIHSISTLS